MAITASGVEDYDPTQRDVPEFTVAELQNKIGEEIGASPWYEVTQKDVDAFAVATDDRNFIHVNPERAKAAGLPGTIAHGFFTLSLLAGFSYKTTPKVKGAVIGYNYGLDKVRFVAQVPVGSRVRGRYKLADVQAKDGACVLGYEVQVEIEGQEIDKGGKPAVVALSRSYVKLGDDA